MDWRALRIHTLTVAAVLVGVVGMGTVFEGAMHADLREACRGLPLLLTGLWWAGRELDRSIRATRVRKGRAAVLQPLEDRRA